MTNQVPIWALWIPFLSAILGGIVTGTVTYLINKTNKDAEERKQRKELAVKLAIENYSQIWNLKGVKVPPLELFVLHMNTLSEAILSDKEITEAEYIKLLKKSKRLEKAHKDYIYTDEPKA